MKEIKYYHLRRNLTDEKPLDFISLDNAYDFLVGFFADKQAKLWHCDGIAGAFAHKPETVSVQEEPNKDIFEYWEKLAKTGDAEAQNNFRLLKEAIDIEKALKNNF